MADERFPDRKPGAKQELVIDILLLGDKLTTARSLLSASSMCVGLANRIQATPASDAEARDMERENMSRLGRIIVRSAAMTQDELSLDLVSVGWLLQLLALPVVTDADYIYASLFLTRLKTKYAGMVPGGFDQIE